MTRFLFAIIGMCCLVILGCWLWSLAYGTRVEQIVISIILVSSCITLSTVVLMDALPNLKNESTEVDK